MAERIKPSGEEWVELVDVWNNSTHEKKLELARAWGVTYDTMKHWLCEGDTSTRKQVGENMEPEPKEEEGQEVIQELMDIKPVTDLDFVCFDLETSNLKADFAIVLSAVIKPFGQSPITFRADDYPEWKENRADDSEIVEAIIDELSYHAIVITHYGYKFDIPFLQAKASKYGLPPLPPMFHIDTYKIAKVAFAVSSRRLEALARHFALGVKSNVEGGLWLEAALNGSSEAMDAIIEHNIQDCILLEKLAALSFHYLKSIPKL